PDQPDFPAADRDRVRRLGLVEAEIADNEVRWITDGSRPPCSPWRIGMVDDEASFGRYQGECIHIAQNHRRGREGHRGHPDHKNRVRPGGSVEDCRQMADYET